MAKPFGPIVGQVHLDDGLHTKFIWIDEQGLQNPASIGDGTMVDTFGGPVMVHPNWASIPARKLTFPGYMYPIAQSTTVTVGQREFMEWLRKSYARIAGVGAPSRVQIGNSYYRGYPTNLEITKFKSHSKILGYSFDLQPDSGAWIQSYRSVLNPGGFARVRYDTPRLERNTGNASGIPILITNSGDMPTKLVATISFSTATRTTRFYVRVVPVNGAAPRRAVFTPNAAGIAYITEADNVILAPGNNYIRLEESNGNLITASSVIYLSAYGTKIRNSNPTGPDLWPIFAHSRSIKAYYTNNNFSAGGQVLAYPEEARYGTIDNYNSLNAGLIVESDSTNVLQYSEEHDNAYWGKSSVTVPTTNVTSPALTATADRIQNSALGGYVYANYTTTASSKWTFSVFAKQGTSGTNFILEIYNVSTATSLVFTNFTITSNWQRFSVTTPNAVASASNLEVRIYPQDSSAVANVDVWGSQLEALSYRSSYIQSPTFASSSNSVRGMDTVYLDNPHNYIAYSSDFRKQTTTQGTPGLWFLDSGCTISATPVAGPHIVPLTASQITFAAAGDYMEQKIINSEQLIGLTRVTLSGWLRNSSTTARSSIIFRLNDRSGANIASSTITTYETWCRFSATFSISSGIQVDRIRIEGTGANSQYIWGIQLTSQSWNGDQQPECREVYTETQSAPILPDDAATDWPLWMTQNGFVQFDIRNNETSRPDQDGRLYFGGFSNLSTEPSHPVVFRGSLEPSTGNQVRFSRLTTIDTAVWATNTNINIHDGAFHTIRIEWTNYILNGVRTMRTSLSIDGNTVTSNAGANDTAWTTPPKFVFIQGRNQIYGTNHRCNAVYKNIVMGVPTLPAGAIPAEY